MNITLSRKQSIVLAVFSVLLLCATLVYRANFKSYFQSELVHFNDMNIRLRHSTINMLIADGFTPATEEYAHVLERRITVAPLSYLAVIHLHPAHDEDTAYLETPFGNIARPGRNRIQSLEGGIPLIKDDLTITVYPVNDSRNQRLLADSPIYRIEFRANHNSTFTIFNYTFTNDMSRSDVQNLLSEYEERRLTNVNNEILFSRNNRVFRLSFRGVDGDINFVAVGFIPRSLDDGVSLDDVVLMLSVVLLIYCARTWIGVLRGKRNFVNHKNKG